MRLKLVTDDQIDALSKRAAGTPRRRANENLHLELSDPVQRFLNAMEPGTFVRPHRHVTPLAKWELFVALRGGIDVLLFDDQGHVTERVEVRATGPVRAVEVPAGAWHGLVVTEPGTVLFEFKQGPYAATDDKDFAAWAPTEGAPAAARFVDAFEKARPGERPADAVAAATKTRARPARRGAAKWKPTPGAYALYVGPTRNATRKVMVLAEASGGWMFVEAVGQKGVNVRFSVKRSNLREPERDLFD